LYYIRIINQIQFRVLKGKNHEHDPLIRQAPLIRYVCCSKLSTELVVGAFTNGVIRMVAVAVIVTAITTGEARAVICGTGSQIGVSPGIGTQLVLGWLPVMLQVRTS
jgi:hypothetical protein